VDAALFARRATSEVFLIDKKIISEADHEKAKEEAVDKLKQATAGLGSASSS
jgi:hypothetical protein